MDKKMKIGIIGHADMGTTLAKTLAKELSKDVEVVQGYKFPSAEPMTITNTMFEDGLIPDRTMSNNQRKRCAKGLHQYRKKHSTKDNMITVIYQCDCGEFEKHFRNK